MMNGGAITSTQAQGYGYMITQGSGRYTTRSTAIIDTSTQREVEPLHEATRLERFKGERKRPDMLSLWAAFKKVHEI